jgi:hypothetical protein
MHLSRDDLLKAEDLVTEEVDLSDLPGYTGSVLVRGLTGRERDEFEASVLVERGGKAVRDLANVRAKIVAKCVVDEDGKRLFTDSDVAALGEKAGAAIDRMFDAASRLSGLRPGDVDEMVADFPPADGSSSSSGSPSGSAKPGRNSSSR